ncbi:hypothetical protein [Streptomyces agglomeratus]|uniref:hypothetical protein n=1 Tax=Streptomyces agglomeratus TaxID=285458 RepID=UPI000AF40F78
MTTPDFRPTHVVPQDGLPAWEEPDVSRPTEPLDPLLPVQLIGRRGDWGQILCANGWSAWVDGRLLVSVPREPPVAGQPMARTADPRPLLARVEESLSQYRRAAEDLTAGRTDGEGFRRRTRGLRVGTVVDGESVWLYDAEHERWVYCDGTRLTTYAASASPTDAQPPPREPTQVAARPPEPAADPGGAVSRDGGAGPPPPEPTQVVAPPAGAPTGPPDDGHPAPPEPTRVVGPPAVTDTGPAGHDRAAPPEPTRVVDPQAGAADPTQVAAPITPDDTRPAPPEPTRVVEPPAHPPTGPPGGDRAATPEPTRVVDSGQGRPAGDDGDDGSGSGSGSGSDDRTATRLVGPGDGASRRPTARPGDG